MANNKVVLANGTVLIDLTGDTVTSDTLLQGATAHAANGQLITGAYVPPLIFPISVVIDTLPVTINDSRITAATELYDIGTIVDSEGNDISKHVNLSWTTASGSITIDGTKGPESILVKFLCI